MLSNFSKLPDAGKGAVLGGAGGGGVGIIAVTSPNVSWPVILLLSLGVFIVFFVGFMLFVSRAKKRRSQGMIQDLKRTVGSETGQMRDAFFDNLDKYRGRYQDVDKWPWFLVMGAPGSGKSYALRKSEIEWDTDTNVNQGVGGTKFIDWWMSKEGIFLDTAGRYTELIAGESGESEEQIEERLKSLREFLTLLRRNRPNCPINGMVLVISAIDLQVKSPEERLTDARKLRKTLHLVQDALQVRFPLIVWVTKCDKIPGFVDYFKSVANNHNVAVRQQMVGWSKPGDIKDLSEPFSITAVNKYLREIISDLKAQRSELLDSLGAADLRTSSSLYVFPDEFARVLGLNETDHAVQRPLEDYLAAVFREPEDAKQRERIKDKPPFIRGIYFTSAITEGEELDRRRAELENRSLLQLVKDEQTKVKQHEPLFAFQTPFFFKDSLVKKLVKEAYLVTRYGDALRGLRLTIGLITTSILLAFLAMGLGGWYMKADMEKSVGAEARLWTFFANGLKDPRDSIQLIKVDGGGVRYKGATIQRELGEDTTLDAYHYLREKVTNELGSSVLFGPFHSTTVSKESRQAAWEKLTGKYALRPIFEETAQQLGRISDWNAEKNHTPGAVVAFINWEATPKDPQRYQSQGPVLGPMVTYLTKERNATEMGALDELLGIYLATARSNTLPSYGNSLRENKPLDHALMVALNAVTNDGGMNIKAQELVKFSDMVENNLEQSEDNLRLLDFSVYRTTADDFLKSIRRLDELFDAYHQNYLLVREQAQKVNDAPRDYLAAIRKSAEEETIKPIETLRAGLSPASDATPLKADILQRLDRQRGMAVTNLAISVLPLEEKIAKLDLDHFDSPKGGEPRFQKRHRMYLRGLISFDTANLAAPEEAFMRARKQAETLCAEAKKENDDLSTFLEDLTNWALKYKTNFFQRRLLGEARGMLAVYQQFPLAPLSRTSEPLTVQKVIEARRKIQSLKSDLSGAGIAISDPVFDQITTMENIATFLVDAEGARRFGVSVITPREAALLHSRNHLVISMIPKSDLPSFNPKWNYTLRVNDTIFHKINAGDRPTALEGPSDLARFEIRDITVDGTAIVLSTNKTKAWGPLEFLTRADPKLQIYAGATNVVARMAHSDDGPLLLDFRWNQPIPKGFFELLRGQRP